MKPRDPGTGPAESLETSQPAGEQGGQKPPAPPAGGEQAGQRPAPAASYLQVPALSPGCDRTPPGATIAGAPPAEAYPTIHDVRRARCEVCGAPAVVFRVELIGRAYVRVRWFCEQDRPAPKPEPGCPLGSEPDGIVG